MSGKHTPDYILGMSWAIQKGRLLLTGAELDIFTMLAPSPLSAKEVTEKLIKLYGRYRPLSYVEKTHLFDALKMISLIYVAWFFYEKKYKGRDLLEKSKRELSELDQIGREKFYNKLFN